MSQPPQPVIHEDANGKYTFHVGQLSSVGIKNIGNVERHDINTVFGSRSHVVRFVNGGVLQFAYNAKNELIELTASKLTMHLSKSGAAIFDVFEDCESGLG
jgi:hypothetical protein